MNVTGEVALEFLRTFARCEYALKAIPEFCGGPQGGSAVAKWDEFANVIADVLNAHPNIDDRTRQLLLVEPPMKQIRRGGIATFEPVPWGTANPGSRLLESVRRVRNNLFHGGKEVGERARGHDQLLVEAALAVLRVAMTCRPDVERLSRANP
jgi:hypothetical protein